MGPSNIGKELGLELPIMGLSNLCLKQAIKLSL